MSATDKPRVDFPVHRTALSRGQRRCRECRRWIYFYRHPVTGSPMPLDVASKVLSEGGSFWRMEVHFAHCTAADRFRRPAVAPEARRRRARREPVEVQRSLWSTDQPEVRGDH